MGDTSGFPLKRRKGKRKEREMEVRRKVWDHVR
jgi:hypothetical protein